MNEILEVEGGLCFWPGGAFGVRILGAALVVYFDCAEIIGEIPIAAIVPKTCSIKIGYQSGPELGAALVFCFDNAEMIGEIPIASIIPNIFKIKKDGQSVTKLGADLVVYFDLQ